MLKLNRSSALALWEKGCDLGWVFACRSLADVLEKGDTVPRDPDAAAKYRAKADALSQKPLP